MDATDVRVLELPPGDRWETVALPVILVVLGGVVALLGAGVVWWVQEGSRKKAEKRQLAAILMLFLDEFVEAFRSCVKYARQHVQGTGLSFSTIYAPTDASMLAEFFRLCEDKEPPEALFLVKQRFFQAASVLPRLADAVHRSATPVPTEIVTMVTAPDPAEKERSRYAGLALEYRGAVLAFFLGGDSENHREYRVLVANLRKLIVAARRMPDVNKARLAFVQNCLLEEHQRLLKASPKLAKFDTLTRYFSHPEEEPPVKPDEQDGEAGVRASGDEPE